jgi:hypothetical protein
MRCEEVVRELNVPSDGRDERALAQHLAECKACALRADRSARLDRLWDATRPADPGAEAWDRVWSSVTASLDRSGPRRSDAEGMPYRATALVRPWRKLVLVGSVFSLTTLAAAVLVATGLSWFAPAHPSHDLVLPGPESVVESVVDVPDGQVVYIRSVGSNVKVIDVTAVEAANGEDPWFNFFNRAEGESGSAMVAMSE